MSALPSVAVVIPTYNRWPHVQAAVDSVLAQTWPALRCVVVDDASTDGTVERLVAIYGPRILLVRQPHNREKSAARNAGVLAAENAEYVCMLDSDDVLLPNAVSDRMKIFHDAPDFHGVSFGLARRQGHADAGAEAFLQLPKRGDMLARYLACPSVRNNDYLLPRSAMIEHGMYAEELTNREDVELLIRLAARLEFSFCGTYVAEIRTVDRSARSDFRAIIRQGRRMTDRLRQCPDVVARLGTSLDELELAEISELARACYKTRDYAAFHRLYREMCARWPAAARRRGNFARRYWVTWLAAFFQRLFQLQRRR